MTALPAWFTRVESDSMAPGLRDGQLVLTIAPRRKHRFRRGVIVAVDSREIGQRIVKRIIGLPGDRLRLDGSHVWVDEQLLDEPYASAATHRASFDVPAGHYFLLGDNRDASSDSRSWRQPYVSRSEIAGILLLLRSRQRRNGPDPAGRATRNAAEKDVRRAPSLRSTRASITARAR
ncbi:signal peptidase I [Rhodococcus chondri]|uniref:Signal peptidase I n=1 Tax=Rhodococcus chondri TaxID=3065941 RepID=A0ABU7JS92_9NOCA|nr:signal peptidase I [Rhodococcus sp. CC-R104]MEE2032893.1 signal peptidase I [Rhodococcus sp. CC-R104]